MVQRPWFPFAERAHSWFWARVAAVTETSGAALGVFRWVLGVYLLAFDLPGWAWLDRVPGALFAPPVLSLASLAGGFPPAPFFTLLDCAFVVSLGLVTVGYFTRAATASALLLALVGFNFNYSFGKVDHGGVTTLLVLACMLTGSWGAHYSLDSLRRPAEVVESDSDRLARARALALFGVALAFGMLTAGLPKAASWIDFDLSTSGFLSWYYPNRYSLGRDLLLAPLVPRTPLLAFELGDYIAPLLELLGVAAVLSTRRLWRLWLALVALFHLINALVLNIPFTNQAITYLVFWDTAAPLVRRTPLSFRMFVRIAVPLVALLAIDRMGLILRGISTGMFLASERELEELHTLLLAVPLCALVTLALGYSALRTVTAEASGQEAEGVRR